MNNNVLIHALKYAAMGYKVFPCIPNKKKPAIEHGVHDASDDPDVLEKMFSNRHSNIGLSTHGLVVIDNDTTGGEWPDKDRALTMMDCPMARTPHGGLHSVYVQPKIGRLRNTQGKLCKGVDTRADNGYILVEPSVVDGKAYQWVSELVDRSELSEPPEWLIVDLYSQSSRSKISQKNCNASTDGQDSPIHKGFRHPHLVSFAGSLRHIGGNYHEILQIILLRNKTRCKPPLDDKEVEKIAKSVLNYEPSQVAVAVAENKADDDAKKTDPGILPAELMRVPGFISEVMDFTLSSAPYPNQAMAFCGALSLQAHLAARKVRDSSDIRTNLYLIGLAYSGAGKDWPRKINAKILHAIGQINTLGERFASGEGIQDSLYLSPSLLLQTDEIDGMLASMSTDKDNRFESIMSTLLTMYSSSNSVFPMRKKAGKEKAGEINQPSICIFGSAIPENYYRSLSSKMMSGGLLSRFLVIESGPRGKGQDGMIADIPKDIVTAASLWSDFCPGGNLANEAPIPEIIPADDEAHDLLIQIREECDIEYGKVFSRGDEGPMSIWARSIEQIKKLALIYACSENCYSGIITKEGVLWAKEVIYHQIKRSLYLSSQYVSDSYFHSSQLKIKRLLKKNGGEMTRTKLIKSVHLKSKELNEIISSLEEGHEISVVKSKDSTTYSLIKNLLI